MVAYLNLPPMKAFVETSGVGEDLSPVEHRQRSTASRALPAELLEARVALTPQVTANAARQRVSAITWPRFLTSIRPPTNQQPTILAHAELPENDVAEPEEMMHQPAEPTEPAQPPAPPT